MHELFIDRRDAGRKLAYGLLRFSHERPVVLALPREGVPVGYEVARVLGAPIELFIVRKVGLPGRRELAIGALTSGGIQVVDGDLVRKLSIAPRTVDVAIAEEMRQLARLEEHYGAGHAPPLLRGHTAILVDAGLAVGLTMRAAVQAVRRQQPSHIVVAAPVGSRDAVAMLQAEAADVVCLHTPDPFVAVSRWYARAERTTGEDVRALLGRASDRYRLAG